MFVTGTKNGNLFRITHLRNLNLPWWVLPDYLLSGRLSMFAQTGKGSEVLLWIFQGPRAEQIISQCDGGKNWDVINWHCFWGLLSDFFWWCLSSPLLGFNGSIQVHTSAGFVYSGDVLCNFGCQVPPLQHREIDKYHWCDTWEAEQQSFTVVIHIICSSQPTSYRL